MARLGLVVEGESEYFAIPILLQKAGASPGQKVVFRGQGTQSPIPILVQKRLLPATRALTLRSHSKVLVVIDREDRPDCPGDFAQRVCSELVRQLESTYGYRGTPPIVVVVADRTLENWLIADPQGIRQHAYISRDIARRVGSNADGLDAIRILQWAYRPGKYYHKTKDGPALAARVRVLQQGVRRCSKSLDKLLREAGA